MSATGPDQLHRTLKLEYDEGRVSSPAEAQVLVANYRLQIDVGARIETSHADQATFLTALNTGVRAFLGGVTVRSGTDPYLSVPWAQGRSLFETINEYGARPVTDLDPAVPTLRIGCEAASPAASVSTSAPVLALVCSGWTAHISPSPPPWSPADFDFSLTGVLAGAIGVSEMFQYIRGDTYAARREIALSLWELVSDGSAPQAQGPVTLFLPARLWLVGLGHLGQAYAWVVGMLPYATPGDVTLQLQDDDNVVEANISTGLLTAARDVTMLKTRVLAAKLESLGFTTRLVERRFGPGIRLQADDPVWALGGLDAVDPRRWMHEAGFDRYFDAGIGSGSSSYLDTVVQVFPSQQTAQEAFPAPRLAAVDATAPAYERIVQDCVDAGESEANARCGVIDLAGRAVGASFVGAAVACIVMSCVLRELNGSPYQYAVVGVDLREPQSINASVNSEPGPASNPGYTSAAMRKV